MERRTKLSCLERTRMILCWVALVLTAAPGADAAEGSTRQGAPGQSTRQDVADWETLAQSPSAPSSPGRVYRRNGKWRRSEDLPAVPVGTIPVEASLSGT